jgi:hypothetical protein
LITRVALEPGPEAAADVAPGFDGAVVVRAAVVREGRIAAGDVVAAGAASEVADDGAGREPTAHAVNESPARIRTVAARVRPMQSIIVLNRVPVRSQRVAMRRVHRLVATRRPVGGAQTAKTAPFQ